MSSQAKEKMQLGGNEFVHYLTAISDDVKSEPFPRNIAGASQFLNSGGKFSLAPGFSPVMRSKIVGKPF
jgi:hypothetical protein